VKKRGFTLIELLVVIGILATLLALTLIAINPLQYFTKTRDLEAATLAADFIKASNIHFASTKSFPWEKDVSCNNEIASGGALFDMPSCLSQVTQGGVIETEYKKNQSLKDIYAKKCGNTVVVCYEPKSKEVYPDAKYTKFGVNQPGCPGSKNTGVQCYWCKKVHNTNDCEVEEEVPTPTPTPTNPWGMAANFAGKYAGINPPSYTPILEFMRAPYSSFMDLSSPNVTVEAWIKPNIPTPTSHHYRIVDDTYRLTLIAKPEGPNIAYQYYFDVQSANNGCGQTVVYSGSSNWNPWDISNFMIASPADFSTWRHVAGVLQNGNLHIYENGVKLNSYNINMTVCNDGRALHIGAGLYGKNTPYYDHFQGLIDEVRISNIARYTSNFTRPLSPFVTDQNTRMLYHFDGNGLDSSTNNIHVSPTGDIEYMTSDIPY